MTFNNGLPDSSLFCCISLLCLPHRLSAKITCVVCSSGFYALCTISIHYIVTLLCSSTPALSSFFTHKSPSPTTTTATTTPSLLYTMYIYSFYASYACNIFHSYACSYRTNLLHLSSALRDHYRNSSDSLVVFLRVQHHWMLC
jgi:hypothetical protein